MSSPALARKARSEAICQAEGAPFAAHLPVIENEQTAKIRAVEEVAWRALALGLAAVKGEGLEQEQVLRVLNQYQLEAALTPKERAFIYEETPSESDRIQFAWRYECFWTLLWALSYIEELGRPDHICDVPLAVTIMVESGNAENFIKGAKLRSIGEILDAADLLYRYDWACVDARIKGEAAPAGLDSGVVLERHYALNWLVGYGDQAWDDISTDT